MKKKILCHSDMEDNTTDIIDFGFIIEDSASVTKCNVCKNDECICDSKLLQQ